MLPAKTVRTPTAQAGLFQQRHRSLAAVWIFAAIMIVAATLLAVLAIGPLAYVVIIPAVLVLVAANPQFALILTLSAIYFQSVLIAIMMPSGLSGASFQSAQALSLVLLAALAVGALFSILKNLKLAAYPLNSIFKWTFYVLGIVAIYSAFGLTKSSAPSVAAYVRLYCLLPFGIYIGLAFGRRMDGGTLCDAAIYLTIIAVLFGYAEVLFPRDYYSVTNIVQYVNFKYQGDVHLNRVEDLMRLATRSLLNLSGHYALDIKLVRPYGPTVHSISYAYCVAFGTILAVIRREWWVFVISLPLLIFVGSKGVLVLVFVALLIHGLAKSVPIRALPPIFWSVMAVYVTVTLIYGKLTSDYHYLGIQGSMIGFGKQPWGHGVGMGGNLSDLGRSDARDFRSFTKAGAADFALESGIGVILYQMGVLGFAFLYLWYRAARTLVEKARSPAISPIDRRACVVLGYGFLTLLVSSLFQEEGLSPAALGIWTILISVFLARVAYTQADLVPTGARSARRSDLDGEVARG